MKVFTLIKNKNFRINIIYILVAITSFILSRVSTSVEMESLGGDLFTNLLFYSFLDIITSVIVFQCIISYDTFTLLKKMNIWTLFLFFFFIFAPLNLNNFPNTIRRLYTVITLTAKVFSDLSVNFLFSSLREYIPHDALFSTTMFSMFFSRICLSCLPYINYFFEFKLNLHPFTFLFILSALSRIAISFVKSLVEIESINENTNEKELKEFILDTNNLNTLEE